MTTPNWNKQAALAGALVVLGTAAYWLEYKHKPEQESKEEQNKKLFNLKDIQVKDMKIRDGVGHTYEIKCSDSTSTLCKPGENSKWELVQPLKLKADDSNANALVSALNNLSVSESIDLKDETPEKRASLLKEYGLDASARSTTGARQIQVTTPSGATVLYLGQTHPIGDSIFAVVESAAAGHEPEGKPNENKVYLVPTYFKTNFDHDLTYWRDKKLLTVSAHEVESFSLDGPKAKVKGVRKDGHWTLSTGKDSDIPGDIENIDNLLTATTFLTAKGFASDDKNDGAAKSALKGAKAVLTLSMQQEKGSANEPPLPLVLTLYQKGATASKAPAKKGAPAPNPGLLYATVSNVDPLFELEPNALDRVNKEVKDLRLAKLMTSMERFATKKIEASSKALGAPLVLVDKTGQWTSEDPKVTIASDKVQGLLDKLSGNRVQDYLSGSAYPHGEADALTLKFYDDKGALQRELSFWKNGGKLYATAPSAHRKEAFVVDFAVNEALPWTRDAFAPKAEPPKTQAGPGSQGAPGMPKGLPPGMTSLPGAPPEPGKPLIPQPAKK